MDEKKPQGETAYDLLLQQQQLFLQWQLENQNKVEVFFIFYLRGSGWGQRIRVWIPGFEIALC
jgi:hypothetical protein